jgi:tRNA pseudouridine38-40 synthase
MAIDRWFELVLAYRGDRFSGWQVQPALDTVQGMIQRALKKITKTDIKVVGASRTDAGVHAHDQRASFTLQGSIPLALLHRALRHHLPPEIEVLQVVEHDFPYHARYHARGKHYCYLICEDRTGNPFLPAYAWYLGKSLDTQVMEEALSCLLGPGEYPTLQASGDCRERPLTHLFECRVSRLGPFVALDIVGRSFLYHMVRIIAGNLVQVGLGHWSVDEWQHRLHSGNRRAFWLIAPPEGLHLMRVFQEGELPQVDARSEALLWFLHQGSLWWQHSGRVLGRSAEQDLHTNQPGREGNAGNKRTGHDGEENQGQSHDA